MMVLVRAFLHNADKFGPDDLQSREFAAMMDLVRKNFAYFTEPKSYEDIAKFMDVFCVEYPEAWAKIEQGALKKKNSLPPETILVLLKHFSNQGEGTERFYDQMETAIKPHLASFSLPHVIVASLLRGSRPELLQRATRHQLLHRGDLRADKAEGPGGRDRRPRVDRRRGRN